MGEERLAKETGYAADENAEGYQTGVAESAIGRWFFRDGVRRCGYRLAAVPVARRRRRLDANAYFQGAGLFEGNSVNEGRSQRLWLVTTLVLHNDEAEDMLSNRSIPRATVIPVLAYPDVNEAAAWLCHAFGFSVRLRIGDHRVQLNAGDGAVIIRELRPNEVNAQLGIGSSVTIRIEDADAHCEIAKARGARIMQGPVTHPYGERQYNAGDLAGYSWTFSQSVADVDPAEWGGTPENL